MTKLSKDRTEVEKEKETEVMKRDTNTESKRSSYKQRGLETKVEEGGEAEK